MIYNLICLSNITFLIFSCKIKLNLKFILQTPHLSSLKFNFILQYQNLKEKASNISESKRTLWGDKI